MGNIQIGKCGLKYMQVQTEKGFLFRQRNTNHGNFVILEGLLLYPYKQFRPNVLEFRQESSTTNLTP